MKKISITALCLIKNEENWVWYAIKSVIDYFDKIIVFDTGSTDNTVKIIKSIKSPKIVLEEKGEVDRAGVTAMRQEMLDRTDSEWFLILDGDDIWPKAAIKELIGSIGNAKPHEDAVVVGSWWCLGDVYNYYPAIEKLKHAKAPKDLTGWRSARAIRKINGLHCVGSYPLDSYADRSGRNIAYWSKKRQIFLKEKYFHTSLLPRSSSRKKDLEVIGRGQKTSFHRGKTFPQNFKYPEVFFLSRPKMVPSPWRKMTLIEEFTNLYIRGIRFFKRLVESYNK